MNTEILNNRHDILFLFEVINGNPNGDPDAGNMPRIEPNTNRGIVTDVCLKRKIRNYFQEFKSESDGFEIFVKGGPPLERAITEGVKASDGTPEGTVKWLCRKYFDIRAFGGVLGVGNKVMKGSSHGQVRGPVQFTFSQSYDPINPIDVTITRLVATTIGDDGKDKERTMGSKFVVPYGLYAAKIFVSPAFAETTEFTNHDLEEFFKALNFMFEHDRSASRGEMVVRGIYDFEHVGTQHENNAAAKRAEARLGCCHAHTLFEGVDVRLRDGIEIPESFQDYIVTSKWDSQPLPAGVELHKRHEM